MNLHRLKHLFIIAASMTGVAHAQISPLNPPENTVTKNIHKETRGFDLAFGDQCAAAFKLPGASGKDWGISDTVDGLKSFLRKNPGGIRNRNIVIVIAQTGGIGDFLAAGKLKDILIDNIGNGRIVIMGGSEMRGGKVPGANARIRTLVSENKSVMIYGGPIITAPAKGSRDDIAKTNKIYPTTEAELSAMIRRAETALENGIKTKPHAKPVTKP